MGLVAEYITNVQDGFPSRTIQLAKIFRFSANISVFRWMFSRRSSETPKKRGGLLDAANAGCVFF